MLHKLLVLDGTVHLVHRDFEQSEVGFILIGLGKIPSGLVDSFDHPAQGLLRRNRICLLFHHFAPSLGEWLVKFWVASSILMYFWA